MFHEFLTSLRLVSLVNGENPPKPFVLSNVGSGMRIVRVCAASNANLGSEFVANCLVA